MKNYKKIYAAFILAGGLILHGCNGIFDDLSINPNQPSMGAYFTSPSAVNDAVMTMYGYMSTQRCLGASGSKTTIIRSDEASSNSDYGKPHVWCRLKCQLLHYRATLYIDVHHCFSSILHH